MSLNLHHRELELAILGAAVGSRDPSKAWAIVSEVVTTPLAFYERNEQIMALVIGDLWMRGKPTDAMSVAEGLKQVAFTKATDALRGLKGKAVSLVYDPDTVYEDSALASVGGYKAICDLAEHGHHQSTLKQNCVILMEYYALRQVVDLLKTTAGKLDSPGGRTALRQEVENTTERLIKLMGGRSGTKSMTEAMDAVVAASALAAATANMTKPLWPIPWLNENCRMRLGSMVTLSGTSGGGKTSLAFQAAVATATELKQDGCVGIVSREMSAEDLAAKLMCTVGGLSFEGIEAGQYGEVALRDAQAAVNGAIGASGKSIELCDSMEKLSYKEICAWARSLHTRSAGNLRLLVIDHLGLLDGVHAKQTEYERQTESTRAFKTLAMELRIVVLVLCQLNKAGQRGPGKGMETNYGAEDFDMLDLKGSGSVAHDADSILFICKQAAGDERTLPVKLKVAKNRWGRVGEVPALFKKADNQQFVVYDKPERASSYRGDPSDSEDLFH